MVIIDSIWGFVDWTLRPDQLAAWRSDLDESTPRLDWRE
jgi:hypothetical protein